MGDSGDSTRNAYPLLRITLTLLPLALLLALWRLMPVQRVQAQGIDPVGVVTLEVLESMAPREWTEPCPLLMRVFGRCTTTTFRSASVQPNPRFGTVQYWPRAAEPFPSKHSAAKPMHAPRRTQRFNDRGAVKSPSGCWWVHMAKCWMHR